MNKYIDHTLLKPTATTQQIIQVCNEAKQYNFKSVCVNPSYVELVSNELSGSGVEVCCVVGFPLGANTIETKAFEASNAISLGATEIDMVINISKAIENDFDYIEKEISSVVQASNGKIVKVILETCYLNEEQIVKCCEASKKASANFVKTSTGFGTNGATVQNVSLMKSVVLDKLEVKASGGVRTSEDALKMIEAGATRIGTSNGVSIVKGNNDGNSAY